MTTWTPNQQAEFDQLGIPYLCLESKELYLYNRLLDALRPRFCLEWGAGWSTVYFPWRHPYIERWLAIEHDPEWRERILLQVAPSVEVRVPEDYVHSPVGESFDWIVVDGIMRRQCLEVAATLLRRPRGRCLLHDTARTEYLKWLGPFKHHRKLADGLQVSQHGDAGRGMYLLW